MKRKLLEANEIYGRLTSIRRTTQDHKGQWKWLFQCECGGTTETFPYNVRNGHTQSCGCLQLENTSKTNTTHGFSFDRARSTSYFIWVDMRNRCNNPNNHAYAYYGGRGIKVCERWNDFMTFLLDMGDRPSKEHSLDRIDNDGNYEPTNCRWSTKTEQSINRRPYKSCNLNNYDHQLP